MKTPLSFSALSLLLLTWLSNSEPWAATTAQIEKFAMVIGNNRGLPNERTLKYAAKDADQIAGALIRGQAFEEDRVYCLQNQSLESIRQSVAEMRGRLLEFKKTGKKAMVMLYFSGHGSKEGLHVNGQLWNRKEFLGEFDDLSSDLKILILDACESGDFLRSKGLQLVDERLIEREDLLGSHGRILLSASAKGEAAQESEDYRGAVFTHHLLNALRGLADYDQDGQIRLLEAFDYAQTATRSENHFAEGQSQSPSFDFDVVGENDPILASIERQNVLVKFVGMEAGTLRVFAYPFQQATYHLFLTGRKIEKISLPSGKYTFALGESNKWRVAEADLRWVNQIQIQLEQFHEKPQPFLAPKGGVPATLWHEQSVLPAFRITHVMAPVPMFELTYARGPSRQDLSLTLGYGQGRETLNSSGLSQRMSQYRLALGSAWPILTRWSLQALIGAEASVLLARQQLHDGRLDGTDIDVGALPSDSDRSTWIFGLGIPLALSMDFPWRIRLNGSYGPAAYTYKEAAEGRVLKIKPEATLGIGLRF